MIAATKPAISISSDPKRSLLLLSGPYLFLHWCFSVAEFPDSSGYLLATEHSPFDAQFWRSVFQGHRPVAVLLFFGILKTPEAIKFGHAIVSFSAWAYFAYQFSHLLPARRRTVAFHILMAGVVGGDVLLWNRMLLSESLSLSGQVALLGFAAWLIRHHRIRLSLGVIGAVLLILAVFQIRDSSVLLLLGIVPFFMLVAIRHPDRSRRIVAFAAILTIGIGAPISAWSVQEYARSRYVANLGNVLGKRILISEERTQFFVRAGMPLSNATECLRGRFYYDCAGLRPDMLALENWLSSDGPRTYLRFLVSHPVDLILGPIADRDMYLRLQIQRDYWYGDPAPRCHGTCGRLELGIYEAVTFLSLWDPAQRWARAVIAPALGVGALFVFWRVMRSRALWTWTTEDVLFVSIIAYALIVGIVGAAVTYHADAMEVARHMLPYALLLRLGFVMAILSIGADGRPAHPR